MIAEVRVSAFTSWSVGRFMNVLRALRSCLRDTPHARVQTSKVFELPCPGKENVETAFTL